MEAILLQWVYLCNHIFSNVFYYWTVLPISILILEIYCSIEVYLSIIKSTFRNSNISFKKRSGFVIKFYFSAYF